jgi:two-component system, OmpR family, response regulator CpxR
MKVLMVDDDRTLCDLVSEYLRNVGIDVACAHDGAQGIRIQADTAVDIVLLDVMLPSLDGFEVLARVRRVSDVPVIMLSARGEEADRVRGLESGADDYLPKPFGSKELLARMRALLRRAKLTVDCSTLELDDLRLDASRNVAIIARETIALTSVESAILKLLCERAGRPVSRAHLYRVVFNRDCLPFDRSLDTHVSNLRRKLGAKLDGGPRIQAVRGIGYQYIP